MAVKGTDAICRLDALDEGEQTYLDALSDLVIMYERDHHAVSSLTPHELLAQMLEERGMSQAERSRLPFHSSAPHSVHWLARTTEKTTISWPHPLFGLSLLRFISVF